MCEINWGGGLRRGTKGRALPSRDAPGVNYQADVALKIEKRCRLNEREARRRLNRFFINVGSPYVLNSDYDIEMPSPSSCHPPSPVLPRGHHKREQLDWMETGRTESLGAALSPASPCSSFLKTKASRGLMALDGHLDGTPLMELGANDWQWESLVLHFDISTWQRSLGTGLSLAGRRPWPSNMKQARRAGVRRTLAESSLRLHRPLEAKDRSLQVEGVVSPQ